MTNISIFCDESGHLEHDRQRVMVVGAVTCPTSEIPRISAHLKSLREEYDLNRAYEMKWTKISTAKIEFYKEILDVFFYYNELTFRGVLIPDKSRLDHAGHRQTHDDWYYKMFYEMLRHPINRKDSFRIFLDIKDSVGGPKTRKLHDILCNSIYDRERRIIEYVQQIRSHESPFIQLTDIIIGAIGYKNRNIYTSRAKSEITTHLEHFFGVRSLTQSSRLSDRKFNLFVWAPWDN